VHLLRHMRHGKNELMEQEGVAPEEGKALLSHLLLCHCLGL